MVRCHPKIEPAKPGRIETMVMTNGDHLRGNRRRAQIVDARVPDGGHGHEYRLAQAVVAPPQERPALPKKKPTSLHRCACVAYRRGRTRAVPLIRLRPR